MAEHDPQQQETERWLRRGQYLGEISALCFLHTAPQLSCLPYLLAGTGSQLLLYKLETGGLIRSFEVFDGIRVHGITSRESSSSSSSSTTTTRGLGFEVAVFGERRVKLFGLHIDTQGLAAELVLIRSSPRFSQWVLDVSFFKSYAGEEKDKEEGESCCLAVGCSDNSVRLWDVFKSSVVLEVQSPDRCLLYSMRLWGDNLQDLRIASGTIFNEIIVWKVVPHHGASASTSPLQDEMCSSSSFFGSSQLYLEQHKAAHIGRLIGHEGSIFRIVWSSNGSKLVSVSDDRSARIWAVDAKQEEDAGPVLFGHNARVWDCCISNSLIVSAGEDCTCRVWGLDGKQLNIIKEHIGRGVWRCLYDPKSSLLITAGFDSAVKVHQLPPSLLCSLEGKGEQTLLVDRSDKLTCCIPNSSEHIGLMDSKSEYVRCLRFACEEAIYVATNHGYLYHANYSETQDVKWTKLVQVSEEIPIVCMDLVSQNWPRQSYGVDDWIALGDGKGNMTIIRVTGDICNPELELSVTWSAGRERQLLGTYWCTALGCRFIFTADPRGNLKLWSLHHSLLSASSSCTRTFDVSLVAEYASCYGQRIMCLDASLENEVLVCGDIRGNLVLFPLLKGLLVGATSVQNTEISPLSYFKGAHGISTVSSVSVAKLSSYEIEICSTGGDGCICFLEYNQNQKSLEFIGMKRVKELSLIQSVAANNKSPDDSANCGYAVGFASTDFIIWNLISEAKVVQIPCGGWRRPHAYYLGDVPEMKNCFAYVKDEVIYIHRQHVPESERKIFPQNLHIQFHGREIHSLCFISDSMPFQPNKKHSLIDKSSWIATGCEDGTVRLTRYTPGVECWTSSKLLGEHVGGSAVRSICFVSKVHVVALNLHNLSWGGKQNASMEDRNSPALLISVGAKRVLTCWLMRGRKLDEKKNLFAEQKHEKNGNGYLPSPMSFKWLSTDMPAKNSSARAKTKFEKREGITENGASTKEDVKSKPALLENGETDLESCLDDTSEDDWRYLAVTAFLVKCIGYRLTVCFVVVACSDATLALRALVLPHRLWFDVAVLAPLSSPVLALQHVCLPIYLPKENIQIGTVCIVISGANDGSIAFWDLTDSIEAFLRRLSAYDSGKFLNCQTRPRTGRGSQGGRWWRTLSASMPKKRSGDGSDRTKDGEMTICNLVNQSLSQASLSADTDPAVCSTVQNASSEPAANGFDSSSEICEIKPVHCFKNVHQSGVNCLCVSDIQDCQSSDNDLLFSLISGGDDQALHCIKFSLSLIPTGMDLEIQSPDNIGQKKHYAIRFLCQDIVTSAHSSAVKGVWTDGTWVFSTGLDQRIRCWLLEDQCKLTEQSHLIISVPEPEALNARACGRNQYEIAVTGRGMQMVEFSASQATD